MLGGVYKDFMILRLGPEASQQAIEKGHVRPLDITGKTMSGWVMVEENGFSTDEELQRWLERAKRFVEKLPAK
jgi:hypothetical protein